MQIIIIRTKGGKIENERHAFNSKNVRFNFKIYYQMSARESEFNVLKTFLKYILCC